MVLTQESSTCRSAQSFADRLATRLTALERRTAAWAKEGTNEQRYLPGRHGSTLDRFPPHQLRLLGALLSPPPPPSLLSLLSDHGELPSLLSTLPAHRASPLLFSKQGPQVCDATGPVVLPLSLGLGLSERHRLGTASSGIATPSPSSPAAAESRPWQGRASYLHGKNKAALCPVALRFRPCTRPPPPLLSVTTDELLFSRPNNPHPFFASLLPSSDLPRRMLSVSDLLLLACPLGNIGSDQRCLFPDVPRLQPRQSKLRDTVQPHGCLSPRCTSDG